ncbi:MAG TPA: methyltransferase domain-containing protein [Ktedonobacterales bacterium]
MDNDTLNSTTASYDRVAGEYAAQFFGELAHKPLDRALLDAFAEEVRGIGPVADIGCGPGQVANYLADRGVDARGIDLSPEMVARAQQLSPAIPFSVGSMLALDLPDTSLGGITAFYSIIHIPPAHVPQALAEFHRVLRPGGLLLLAFHVGDEVIHREEWWDQPVALDFQFYQPDMLAHELESAGFTVEMRMIRAPYVPHEHPSQRGYLLARKPRTTET